MIKFRALISSALIAFVLTISGGLPVWAASNQSTGTSLTTTPISAELSGKPGTSVSTVLQVMNNSSVPLNISLQLDTFRASGTSGQAQNTYTKIR